MEDLIVQVKAISAKPEDIILITFGEDYDISDVNDFMQHLNKDFPNLHFITNIEGLIKNITVLDIQTPSEIYFNYSPNTDQEGLL